MRLWLKMKIISAYGTQRAFAQACNKSDNWISEIIIKRRDPSEEDWRLIFEKLGLDRTDELFLDA